MSAFTVKGLTIGAGVPKTVVPLMADEVTALERQARRAIVAGADLVEWRVDAGRLDPAYLEDAARALAEALPDTPILATLRTTEQGGRFETGSADYPLIIELILRTGAIDLVDIELTEGAHATGILVEAAHARGARAVVSHHDFTGTPKVARMVRLIERMAGTSADVVKLAVMAHDQTDALRLMKATAQAREHVNVPLLTLAMGEAGKLSRLAGEAFGSALTFCALDASSAPGQVGLQATRAALSALHEALAPEA